MTRTGPVGVGVIGAGNISEQYLTSMAAFPDLDVRMIADLEPDRAGAQAERHGIPRSGTPEDLIADDGVELVVNLTIPAAHVDVGLAALHGGKHVWTEKPLALGVACARDLLEEARRRDLRVGCAPDTILGAGLQTVQRALDGGAIGTPVSALALMQTIGPEAWHPNPEFLFDTGAGPLFDLGPYFLAAMVQQLGPIARVSATSGRSRATRTIGSGPRAGTAFDVRVPTEHSSLLEFAGGASAVLVVSFEAREERVGLEFTGSDGVLRAPDPRFSTGDSELIADGTRRIPARGSEHGRGTGVLELARALRAGVPERAAGRLGLHVLDAMESITTAAERGSPVELATTCERPDLLPEDWDPTESTLDRH